MIIKILELLIYNSIENDETLFDNYKFSDLFKEIKNRSDTKKDAIDTLFKDIRSFITTKDDAIMLLPRIKECLDVSVKNDEQLVKLAAVAQKMALVKSIGKDGDILPESEKENILRALAESTEQLKNDDLSILLSPLKS